MAEVQKFSKVKLVDLSLKCIIKNFGRYIDARAAGDTIPARNFYFLQKLFSKQLFRELANTKYFVENMEFFLNPYLKEVDLDLCHHDSDITEIIERLKVIGETVTTLILSGYSYTVDMLLNLVLWLPNVQCLTMNKTHATDNVLENIGLCCTKLKNLSLHHSSNISDAGLQLLRPSQRSDGSVLQNQSLQHLELIGTSVTVVGVSFALEHFPNLIVINHKDVLTALYNVCTHIHINDNFQPLKTYKLNELIIEYNKMFLGIDTLRMCTSLCPHVKKLTFEPITSQAQIDVLAGFQQLREVHFALRNFPLITVSPFIEAQGKCLEKLRIYGGSISAESLLKSCPKLKVLDLQEVGFEPIEKFTHDVLEYGLLDLETLCFEEIDFEGNIAIRSFNLMLSSSPNLEILNFVFVRCLTLDFTTSIIQHKCMINIHEINITVSDIKYAAAKKLLSATPNLKICRLTRSKLTVGELQMLHMLYPSIKFM